MWDLKFGNSLGGIKSGVSRDLTDILDGSTCSGLKSSAISGWAERLDME